MPSLTEKTAHYENRSSSQIKIHIRRNYFIKILLIISVYLFYQHFLQRIKKVMILKHRTIENNLLHIQKLD